MALLKMPLSQNLPWYSFTSTLDNATYQFELSYNDRSGRWNLSLQDVTGADIVSGLVLLNGIDLLAYVRHLAVPPGILMVLNDTGADDEPTLGSFLTTHSLYYVEAGT
jgi:hypothetical protein